jgi:aspartate aminotransferase-like enzyme/GNAT superfamily N-acetyltransferase
MNMAPALGFKLANEPAEFEAIHRLNYRTFVEEIPQHPPNAERRLVDRFHAENTYAICLEGETLVGMIAGRSARPFSLESRLPDLHSHLPPHQKLMEVRLLAVLPQHRKQAVFAQLAGTLAKHFRALGCDLAIISGTVRQLRLYRHLGFTPFGPLVGSEGARYQPMYLTLRDYASHVAHLEVVGGRPVTNLMPGPVTPRPAVSQALAQAAVSHRSAEFKQLLHSVRTRLRVLCNAEDVVLMPGTGTLANDAVAAQLAAQFAGQSRPGLVLSNGEFGDRLVDHARRWRLPFEVHRAAWGQGFEPSALRAAFARCHPAWVWMVACETSTGVHNPLALPRELCAAQGADLCVDAVSAVGLMDLDLGGARFVSTVSGKALGAYPGLAIVAHNQHLVTAGQVPRYLDLAAYRDADGVPYTQSSNLLAALNEALAVNWPERWQHVQAADRQLRLQLRHEGLTIVADDAVAMPGVISVALPAQQLAARVAQAMARSGYALAHRSDYLVQRNWLQICLMGEWEHNALQILPEVLARRAQAHKAQAEVQGLAA